MRHIILTAVLIAASCVTAAQAAEDSLTVIGGVDFGFKRLHLTVGPEQGQSGSGQTLSASYVTINPNVVFAYSAFYLSLSYDRSIHADPAAGEENGSGTQFDFSRTDRTITLGYRLNESFGLFAGYTKGENNFVQTSFNVTLRVQEIDFTEKGPFAGISYSKAFGDKGTLGLSVGYAKLDGQLDFTRHPAGAPRAEDHASGDSTGLSYGLTWSGALSGSLGYRIGIKSTDYKMERGSRNPQDITEDYTTFFFGLSNYF